MNKPVINRLKIVCSLFACVLTSFGSHSHASTPDFSLELQQALQFALQDLSHQYGLEGIAASVYASDQCNWVGASGHANRQFFPPIESTMTFGFGSITKTFIAALVLQLAEEDLLSLDDPLNMWLADYRNINGSVTIRQLLSHTSGIYNYLDHPSAPFIDSSNLLQVWRPEDILRSYVLGARFAPGTSYNYSNTNFILLGMIIEAVTGNEVDVELQNRIFQPLGLQHTFLGHGDLLADLANGVEWSSAAHVYPANFSKAWTAYAIASTAGEIARWGHLLYTGKFLEPHSLEQMLDFTPAGNYGLGTMSFNLDRYAAVGHVGHSAGFKSGMAYIPEFDITITYAYHYSSFAAIPESPLMLTTLALAYIDNLPAGADPCPAPANPVRELRVAQSALASFAGAATLQNSSPQSSDFRQSDRIDVRASIAIDPQDVGATGLLYVVISHNGMLYQKTANGFLPVEGELRSLQGISAPGPLQPIEHLDIARGLSGIAGEFVIYTGYSNANNDFRYSANPIHFSVLPDL